VRRLRGTHRAGNNALVPAKSSAPRPRSNLCCLSNPELETFLYPGLSRGGLD
jgi:hypothetical protein